MEFIFLSFFINGCDKFLTLSLSLVILGVQLLKTSVVSCSIYDERGSKSWEVTQERFGGLGVISIDSEGIKEACEKFVLFISMELN